MRSLSTACFFLIICLANPLFAKSNVKLIEEILLSVANDKAGIEKSVRAKGYKGAHQNIMTEHVMEMYTDPEIRKHVAKVMARKVNVKSGQKLTREQSSKIGAELASLVTENSIDGIQRLSPASQLSFIQTLLPLYERSKVQDCATFFVEGADNASLVTAEQRSQQRMKPTELKNYLTFMRAGAKAELANKGRRTKLSRKKSEEVESAFTSQLLAGLNEHPNQKGIEAYWDGNSNDARNICDAGILTFRTVLETPQNIREEAAVWILSP